MTFNELWAQIQDAMGDAGMWETYCAAELNAAAHLAAISLWKPTA